MHCWTRYVFIVVVAALGVLSMIQACGRKGPLYLPDPDQPQSSQTERRAGNRPAATPGSEVPKPPAASAPVEPKWP
jgi:predicted small lipoprotein YifL